MPTFSPRENAFGLWAPTPEFSPQPCPDSGALG